MQLKFLEKTIKTGLFNALLAASIILLAVLVVSCTPITSAVVGGVSAVWHKHERNSLEKRISRLEKMIKKEKDCLLLCDYQVIQ